MALITLLFLWIQTLASSSAPHPVQELASVEGIASELGTGTPLARARVVLSRIDGRAGALSTLTDSAGRFTFRSVSPGTYRVAAARDGYVRAELGQRGPDQAGIPITLAPRQQAKELVIAMIRTGAISGRIFDRFGEPLSRTSVQALKWDYKAGRRVLTPVQTALTNDRGEYRLFWLQPGNYVVNAIPDEAGRGTEDFARIDESFLDSEQRYVPMYAPGTPDPSTASVIELGPGLEATGIDLMMLDVRTVTVRGRVVSNRASAGATRSLVRLIPRGDSIAAAAQRTTPTTPAGTFEFRGVIPGSYDLFANSTESAPAPNGAGTSSGGTIPLAARVSLEVGGGDIDNVSLALQPGFNIPGQIAFEAAAGKQIPNMAGLRVQLRSELALAQPALQSAEVAPNGSFMLPGTLQGTYRLAVVGIPNDSYIKMARLDGADILNSGFRLDGAPRGRLEILLSSNSGLWNAVVFDNNGAPATGVTVVLVPDPTLRSRSDLYRIASTDTAGRIHIEGLMPGEYKAFAWDYVPRGAWQDTNFTGRYEDLGKLVHIRSGDNEPVDLKLIPSGM